jgi:hypothetical protein
MYTCPHAALTLKTTDIPGNYKEKREEKGREGRLLTSDDAVQLCHEGLQVMCKLAEI